MKITFWGAITGALFAGILVCAVIGMTLGVIHKLEEKRYGFAVPAR